MMPADNKNEYSDIRWLLVVVWTIKIKTKNKTKNKKSAGVKEMRVVCLQLLLDDLRQPGGNLPDVSHLVFL